jgi:N-acetylmuramoyl-L-alanine amidase
MFRLAVGVLCAGLAAPAVAGDAVAAGKFVLVIDPGHGGRQAGAKGPGRLWEKAVSLSVAKKLGQLMRNKLGAEVIFTRETDVDVPLPERVARANEGGAELFVSVHANSMPTESDRRTARGVETFFLSADATDEAAQATADRENDEGAATTDTASDEVTAILDDLARTAAHTDSSRLAYVVQRRLSADLGIPDRGVKQAPFRVLMGAKMPAVLVEIGFISHPVEGKRLGDASYQEQVAKSLAEAIGEFRAEITRRDVGPAPAASSRAGLKTP